MMIYGDGMFAPPITGMVISYMQEHAPHIPEAVIPNPDVPFRKPVSLKMLKKLQATQHGKV